MGGDYYCYKFKMAPVTDTTSFLVCIDGSSASYEALEQTVKLARKGETVILLHVHTSNKVSPQEAALDQKILTAAEERCKEAGLVSEVMWEENADVVDKIVEIATYHSVDFIAVGSHGYGGVLGSIMGSVSTALVKQAPCPVIICKKDSAE